MYLFLSFFLFGLKNGKYFLLVGIVLFLEFHTKIVYMKVYQKKETLANFLPIWYVISSYILRSW